MSKVFNPFTGKFDFYSVKSKDAVSDMQSASGADNDLCYCVGIETLYRYELNGADYGVNTTSVLSTGAGGDTRWVGVSGRYIAGELTVKGTAHMGGYLKHDGDTDTYMRFTDDQIDFCATNVFSWFSIKK